MIRIRVVDKTDDEEAEVVFDVIFKGITVNSDGSIDINIDSETSSES